MPRLILLLATVSTGLFAGFCFCYAVVVVPMLSHLDDEEYVTMMRKLNNEVPGVPFFLVLAGSVVSTLVALGLHTPLHPTRETWLIAAAAVCCLAAVVITVTGNVPMNGRLSSAATDSAAAYHHARLVFESTWNTLHMVRTLLLVAGLVLLSIACLRSPATAVAAARAVAEGVLSPALSH